MPKLEKDLIIDRCPHCNVDNPNLVQSSNISTISIDGANKRIWATYTCRRCGGVTTAWAFQADSEKNIQEIFPSNIELDISIPDRARTYLDQAIDSLHAPAGSIMLSASSIDAMLKEKGYKNGTLYNRINKAVEDHLITKEMADWAHEVRLDANDQRHADEHSSLPNEKDAQTTIDFTIALAQFLFVMPSRVRKGIENAKKE